MPRKKSLLTHHRLQFMLWYLKALLVEVDDDLASRLERVAPTVANLDNLHVVAKRLLSARAGALPPSREVEVKRALGYALGWIELKAL